MNNEPVMAPENGPDEHEMGSVSVLDERPSYFGLIIGILIIILSLLLVGLYMWSQLIISTPEPLAPLPQRPSAAENNEPESTTAEAQAEILQTVSTSDEISAIEADLEATNLENIDTEMNAIDAEIEAQ